MSSTVNRLIQFALIAVIVGFAGRALHQRFGTPSAVPEAAAATDSVPPVVSSPEPSQTPSTTPVDDPTNASAGDTAATDDDPIGTLLGIGFGVIHTASQVGNDMLDELAGLTIDEEKTIGREAWQETISHHTPLDHSQAQSRIERLAAPFLAERKRKEIDYRFTIIDDDLEGDFGDAPAPYPTQLDQNPARHVATGPSLGHLRETEMNGSPTASADGDGILAGVRARPLCGLRPCDRTGGVGRQ